LYQVYFATPRIARQLSKLPSIIEEHLLTAIQNLSQNPRPHGTEKLKGKLKGAWRVRVGDYRILYDIHDDDRKVVILEIGHRREIYR